MYWCYFAKQFLQVSSNERPRVRKARLKASRELSMFQILEEKVFREELFVKIFWYPTWQVQALRIV